MARFATLFPSAQQAEQVAGELEDTEFSEEMRTQIVSQSEWQKQWDESDQKEVAPPPVASTNPTDLFDIWMDEDTIKLFAEGLKQGGVVLVVDVPDPFAPQVEKILHDHQATFGS